MSRQSVMPEYRSGGSPSEPGGIRNGLRGFCISDCVMIRGPAFALGAAFAEGFFVVLDLGWAGF